MTTIQYQVSGLSCDGCVQRVQKALADHAESINVTLRPPMATLINPTSDLQHLNKILSKMGDYQLSITTDVKETTLSNQTSSSWLAHNKLMVLIGGLMIFLVITLVTLTP